MSTQIIRGPLKTELDEASLLHEVVVVRQWVSDLMARLDWRERKPSYHALLTAFHAFRDCLSREDAVHLGVALPLLVRGLYFEGWRGGRGPASARTRKGFLERLHEGVGRDPGIDPDQLARAFFAVLAAKLSPSEVENVRAATPIVLHAFWPD
jgi:uncharacterized protein (DUF2267 family)